MSAALPAAPLLEARNICKAFPGVQALREVHLHIHAAEVLAVVGENGAGKSTLMNILGGALKPDAGTIRVDGREVDLGGVDDAEREGIALITQELSLADNLDVAGNVFLGREPTWGGPLRLLDRRRLTSETRAVLSRLGWDGPPGTRVADLSPGHRQLVEIARALSLRSRILIMDEPTSSLARHETQQLFRVVRDLKRSGVGILYISHRLHEVMEIADRVVVLRDGRNAGELRQPEIEHDALVGLMVGRNRKAYFRRSRGAGPIAARAPVLRADGLRWGCRRAGPMSFILAEGEIVGMAGLVGAGRTELAEVLFGIRPITGGALYLEGRPIAPRAPSEAIARGLLLVPEDRRSQGLLLPASVRRNIALPNLDRLSRVRLVVGHREAELARNGCRRLGIRTPSPDHPVGLLSGGNQQKVVLAKWLVRTPRVLVLDEPTRGVDVGAKSEIYALMDRLAASGMAILMISSDLEEILGVSDRVLIMHEGTLAGELSGTQVTEDAVMRLAAGGGGLP